MGEGGAAVPIDLGEPLRSWVLDPDLEKYRGMDPHVFVNAAIDTVAGGVADDIRADYLACYDGRSLRRVDALRPRLSRATARARRVAVAASRCRSRSSTASMTASCRSRTRSSCTNGSPTAFFTSSMPATSCGKKRRPSTPRSSSTRSRADPHDLGDGSRLGDVVATAMDPRARVHGRVHVAARHHGGERGVAIDSARSGGEPAGLAVGECCVCAGAGGAAAAGGHAGRQAGPAPALPGRPRDLHARVAGVCVGCDRAGARVVPCAAGSRRRGAVRHRHAAAARGVLGCCPKPGVGRLRRDARRGQRHRTVGRWSADRHTGLAVHLLRQPADRRGGVGGRGDAPTRIT